VNLRRFKSQEEPELNVTSFIDIVLLLLIFFVTTTTFMKDGQIQLQLPKASGDKAGSSPPAQLSIDARGHYYLNGQEIVNRDIDTIKVALQKLRLDPKTPLVIRADAKAAHQAVVTAMDAAGQVGLTRISIATDNAK
jgi:biopolymer transport protein ExbD